MYHFFKATFTFSSYVFTHFVLFFTLLETIVKIPGFIGSATECHWKTRKLSENKKTDGCILKSV